LHESSAGQIFSDGSGSMVHCSPTKPGSHGADTELLGLKNQFNKRTIPVSESPQTKTHVDIVRQRNQFQD
jgi:hypothetical protein